MFPVQLRLTYPVAFGTTACVIKQCESGRMNWYFGCVLKTRTRSVQLIESRHRALSHSCQSVTSEIGALRTCVHSPGTSSSA